MYHISPILYLSLCYELFSSSLSIIKLKGEQKKEEEEAEKKSPILCYCLIE